MAPRIVEFEKVESGGDSSALEVWEEALRWARSARKWAALTGAGVSVESGVPDFRSPQGVWARFSMEEYGTIEAFRRNPAKAWRLYRAIWEDIGDKEPNPAHLALARLEREGRLAGLVTQNIDNLHQKAGSRRVIEIHGDSRSLQCVECGWTGPARVEELLASPEVPLCPKCGYPLKPNVVMFGEDVRGTEEIEDLLEDCDLMLVVGTSAEVYPANLLPARVARSGGRVIEFNLAPSALTEGRVGGFFPGEGVTSDLLILGKAGRSLPAFAEAVLGKDDGAGQSMGKDRFDGDPAREEET